MPQRALPPACALQRVAQHDLQERGMADDDRTLARDRLQSDFDPFGKKERLTGYGETSEGLPPRQIGGAPGFGAHGMGYGPQGGSGDAWGVYGVPRNVAQDYVDASRAGAPGEFDQPHGRVGFGWDGGFGSEGEFTARSDRIGPRGQPSDHAPNHETQTGTAPRGRPPKNYTRSDERIFDEIFDAIARDTRIDAREVTVEVKDGNVTLYGSVAHRQMKHWIEDIAAECHGVKDVDNRITVALAAASPADRRISPHGIGH
jgi:hypothetical protein